MMKMFIPTRMRDLCIPNFYNAKFNFAFVKKPFEIVEVYFGANVS